MWNITRPKAYVTGSKQFGAAQFGCASAKGASSIAFGCHEFCIYGILKKSYKFATKELGDEFKEGVVSQFTNGRTTSLREMTRKEYDLMCDKLEGATAKLIRTAKDEQRRHRSWCLRLMQMLGIDTTDWTRINAFCQDQRIAGKVFSKLSNEELEQLSVKLRSIQRKGGLKPKKEPTPPAQPQVEYMMLPIGNGGEA